MSLQPCALTGNHEAEETSTAICYFYSSPVCHLASIEIFYLWRIQWESNSNLRVDLCVVLPPLPASRNAVSQVRPMTRMTTVLPSFLGARFSFTLLALFGGRTMISRNKLYHCKDARECLVDQNDLLCQPQQMQEMNTKERQKVRQFGRYLLWHIIYNHYQNPNKNLFLPCWKVRRHLSGKHWTKCVCARR